MPLPLGSEVAQYVIQRELGHGVLGSVYRAHDTIHRRDVALKLLTAPMSDPDRRARFRRNAPVTMRVTHANLVKVHEIAFTADDRPFVVMELLEGQDLRLAMRAPTFALDRKLGTVVQVLAGLAHAHGAGFVHLDVKPANVFVEQNGTAKITDLCLAHVRTLATAVARLPTVVGYWSPEKVKSAHIDARSDIFSVGCILYELLSGRPPFQPPLQADQAIATLYKICTEEPDYARVPADRQCQHLIPIVQRALAKEPDGRYESARAMAEALAPFVAS